MSRRSSKKPAKARPVKAVAAADPPKPVRGPDDPKRGPLPEKLNVQQRQEFCRLVAQGMKRMTAVEHMGVKPHVLRNTLAADPGFVQDVADAEERRSEDYHTVLHVAATGGDVQTARYMHDFEHRQKLGREESAAIREREHALRDDGYDAGLAKVIARMKDENAVALLGTLKGELASRGS